MTSTASTESTQDDLRLTAALGHTPESFIRTLMAGITEELAGRDGPLEDQSLTLTVTARPIDPATDEAGGHILHPHLTLCVQLPHEHGACIVLPPWYTPDH